MLIYVFKTRFDYFLKHTGTFGFRINENRLISLMKELSGVKKEYDKISFALHEVREKGYGIVSPGADELTLDKPKIVNQGEDLV